MSQRLQYCTTCDCLILSGTHPRTQVLQSECACGVFYHPAGTDEETVKSQHQAQAQTKAAASKGNGIYDLLTS